MYEGASVRHLDVITALPSHDASQNNLQCKMDCAPESRIRRQA